MLAAPCGSRRPRCPDERLCLAHPRDEGATLAPSTLHAAVEAWARATPGAPAVRAGSREVSYAEFNAMANEIAHRLLESGAGGEQFVGVVARRSVETLVGIVAVLKAGAAYVLLDPHDPPPRLRSVIGDAQSRVVLAGDQDRGLVGATETVSLDSPTGSEDPHDLAREVLSEGAACAYYTSGSSGQPKGVVLEHGAILNQVTWVDRALLGRRSLAMPLSAPLTFAASLKQIFVPWLRGDSVWLLDDQQASDPVALLQALDERSSVALNCVPHLWEAVLEAADAGRAPWPRSVRLVCFAGESPSRQLVDRSFAAIEDLEVWNIYAATETGISVAGRLRPGEPLRIGRAIAGAQAHVLDGDLAPVPSGQPGELYVEGAGLARGYLGRPALTAKRFVSHPLRKDPGARVFSTGDVVRRAQDGELEFVARGERLLKVRGFRVDPGEVEDAIGDHPAVAGSAVTVAHDERGTDRLVAHVVPAGSAVPSLTELRAALASKLPSYMLPSRLVVVDALPTTASGKVDRRALVDSPSPRPRPVPHVLARPRNRLERRIVKLWRKVLDVESVAVVDDFFELGGDSLSAVRVVSELEARTGVALAPSALLEASTPERLAKLVARSRPGQQPSTLVTLRSGGAERPLFFVAPGPAMVIGLRRLAERIGSDRAVYVLQSYGLDDDGGSPIETVARRYVAAVRAVQPDGPYLLAGQCRGSVIALEAAQQLGSQDEQVALLAVLDATSLPTRLGPARPRESIRPPRRRRRSRRMRPVRRIARVTWRRPRRRLRYLRRALRSAREARSTAPGTVLALYRQGRREGELREAYAAEPYPGRIHYVVSGEFDQAADRDHRARGWAEIAAGGLDQVVVSGRHVDLLAEPEVLEVAQHFDRWLEEAEAGQSARPAEPAPAGS
jgi:amino acid adenylation domain-containing protein